MPTLAEQIAPKPQQPSGLGGWLASIGDEMAGAFARYGRRSGAQRDASLALLNQAVDPNTDPLSGAAQKVLGLAGLVTHPLAFFPTREEWDQRLQAAGNDGRVSRSIGGFLSDLPSLIDPQMAAGGTLLAAAPIAAKMAKPGLGRGLGDLMQDAANNKELDALGARLQAEAAQTGGAPSSVSREQALQGLVSNDPGIIAYHGSPHSFDKFDMSKIGTGEGAQAYGHGLYFAEAEDVAKTYRDMLSDQPQALPALGWQQRMDWTDAQNEAYGLADTALEELQIDIAQGGATRPDWGRLKEKVRQLAPPGQEDEIVRELESMADKYGWREFVNKNPGSMYQVRLNVKPDELLDWDKPLSEQPKVVQDLAREADLAHLQPGNRTRRQIEMWRTNSLPNKESEPTGNVVHSALTDYGMNPADNAALTNKFKAAGIKGIRYKDAGSRGGEGGTYNYVIFDDNLITILKKYGIPMTAGVGGAMMVAGQDMPPEIAAQMGGT